MGGAFRVKLFFPRRDPQIPALSRGQIADDGGLDVNGCFHSQYITQIPSDGQLDQNCVIPDAM